MRKWTCVFKMSRTTVNVYIVLCTFVHIACSLHNTSGVTLCGLTIIAHCFELPWRLPTFYQITPVSACVC